MTLTLAPRHRAPSADGTHADPASALLARLADGSAELPAFAPVALPAVADHPAEAHAAARAAACPDLFVVHALDHLAGERVIADAARGVPGRTLVLSPNPAAADRIVERLGRAGAAVVRALADDENPVRPSPVVSRLTSAAQFAATADRLMREAVAAVAAADAHLTALERLTELYEKLAALDAESAEVTAKREAVEPAVRAEADGRGGTPFDAVLDQLMARREGVARGILERRAATDASRQQKEVVLADLRTQYVAATADGGKKSGFFSRLLGKKHGPDPAELERQILDAERELGELAARAAGLQAESEAAGVAAAADREKAIAEEVAARRVGFDTRLAELAAERDRLRAAADSLGLAGKHPAGELAAAKYAATRTLVMARERAAEVARTADAEARQWLARIPVVVGTPQSLGIDPALAPAPHGGDAPPFSLLVLDRAEELAEPDFVNLSRLAGRWVLVGNAVPAEEPKPVLNGVPDRHAPGRNGRPVEVPFAARLARLLDREPWAAEADRLVCRLAHPTAEQRRAMTREPLLDRPEVEVRFVPDADGEPVVAELAFPGGTAPADAKAFVFHQLGEVLLRPCGPVSWRHTPDAFVACWPAVENGNSAGAWVELEPGVREKVVGAGLSAFTASVSFDAAAGWDAEKAAAWLDRHLPASAGRFAAVPRGR